MSFFEKARQAAEEAAAQAKIAATHAGVEAREAAVKLKATLTPERLAELIIKATALQERTNATLKAKGSPYRITEISVTAALPPQVGFVIGRVGDAEIVGVVVESADMVEGTGDEAVLDLESPDQPVGRTASA